MKKIISEIKKCIIELEEIRMLDENEVKLHKAAKVRSIHWNAMNWIEKGADYCNGLDKNQLNQMKKEVDEYGVVRRNYFELVDLVNKML